MFKGRETADFGFGPQLGQTAPALASRHTSPSQVSLGTAALNDYGWHLRQNGKRWFVARLRKLDIATDLAEEIGSGRWFRGLGVMLGLIALALSFWPDYSYQVAGLPADRAVRDEFRSQIIMPQIKGRANRRRMAFSALVAPIASAPERAQITLVATLGADDSFARMLTRAGVSGDDAVQAGAMIARELPLNTIAPGTRFDVVLGRRNPASNARPLNKLAFRARFDLDLVIARRSGALSLQPRTLTVDTTPLRIQGLVGQSLYRSARSAGAPIEAVQQYLQVLDRHLSLDSDISANDTFDFVISHKRSAGGETEPGKLLYAGLSRNGRPLAQLVRWGEDGQFYEASGIGTQRAATYAPVAGRVTSGYGMRFHPVLGYSRMHAGVDFGAAYGSPIYAVSSGTVSWAGPHGGHGNYVRLQHSGAMSTGYGHMSRIAVSSGERVNAGQVIGYVGSTGVSTGPHLHYEVYQNGRSINPMSVRFSVNSQVDAKQTAAFKAKLAELLKTAPGAALKP